MSGTGTNKNAKSYKKTSNKLKSKQLNVINMAISSVHKEGGGGKSPQKDSTHLNTLLTVKYHQNYLMYCKFELLHYFTHQFICHHTLQKASSIPKNYKHQVFSWKWQVRYMKTFAYAYFIKCCQFITIWEWLKQAAEENIFVLFILTTSWKKEIFASIIEKYI